MRFLTDRIYSLISDWNKRPLTEADFFAICRRQRIGIKIMPLSVGGFYYRVMGRDFIAIDSRLKGAGRLEVMFHELGHYLLHVPDIGVTANFHGLVRGTRQELEADVFAACAIIPKSRIDGGDADDLFDEGFAPELIAARLRILNHHGI